LYSVVEKFFVRKGYNFVALFGVLDNEAAAFLDNFGTHWRADLGVMKRD
jgi:hypothetical protein